MLMGHLRSLWATDWATRAVAQLSEGLSRDVAPCEQDDRPERRKPRECRAFGGAPKRTRTSTRLSRTRPSTWRVYQFRHRREGDGEYSPVIARGLSPSAGVGTLCEHMFDGVEEVPNRMDIGKDLTKRQQEIFDFIKRYSASHGYPPTVRDIGKAVGLASSSTVHAHLANLEKVGLLRRDPSKPRAI